MILDHASPQACQERSQRLESAQVARQARTRNLESLRAIQRNIGIHTEAELFDALNNILSACASSVPSYMTEALTDLCCDLENSMREDPPELSAIPQLRTIGREDQPSFTKG